MISTLLNSRYAQVGNIVLSENTGVAIGGNSSSLLANLYMMYRMYKSRTLWQDRGPVKTYTDDSFLITTTEDKVDMRTITKLNLTNQAATTINSDSVTLKFLELQITLTTVPHGTSLEIKPCYAPPRCLPWWQNRPFLQPFATIFGHGVRLSTLVHPILPPAFEAITTYLEQLISLANLAPTHLLGILNRLAHYYPLTSPLCLMWRMMLKKTTTQLLLHTGTEGIAADHKTN